MSAKLGLSRLTESCMQRPVPRRVGLESGIAVAIE